MKKIKQHVVGLKDFKNTSIEEGFKKNPVPVIATDFKPRNPHHDHHSGKFTTEARARLSQHVEHIVLTPPLPVSVGGEDE
ncbi:MAG: hypothetical protein Q8M94_06260 [Ignavibacteria bacterium]|nr:hypothetical protein [Ignavibacteria bacterium]